jgi:hypothetical protein
MEVVEGWDRSLRDADWESARAALAHDATYTAPSPSGDAEIACANADEIVDLMRSWKGKLPDVEVVEWEVLGDRVVARLRQPAWGDDADWYQVLTVRDERIVRLQNFPTREVALQASSG